MGVGWLGDGLDLVQFRLLVEFHRVDCYWSVFDVDMVTYEEALKRLVGNPDWWRYDFFGRTDEKIRQAAIELASMPNAAAQQPREFPPLMTQAGNAIAAAGRVVKAIAHRRAVKVAPEVYQERLEICHGCEHHNRACGRCRKCGCAILKLWVATERCPIGKWERIQEQPT